MPGLNDAAWERVFHALPLEDALSSRGMAEVSAEELKLHGQREPRLMAKIDSRETWPEALKSRGVGILPVSNGRYLLHPDPQGRDFFDLAPHLKGMRPNLFRPNLDILGFDSFPKGGSWSESQAIDVAHVTGMLEGFTGTGRLILTLRGRSYGKGFVLDLGSNRVDVTTVQMELDAGFESRESLVLLEAKSGKRDSFHLRQLRYPWETWRSRTHKKLVTVFLLHTNGLFYLMELVFGRDWGDVSLGSKECFVLDNEAFPTLGWQELLASPEQTIPSTDAPFPQANDVDRIIDAVLLLSEGSFGKAELADRFSMTPRQGDYYGNAAVYLGLARRQAGVFQVSESGDRFARLISRSERVRAMALRMGAHPALRPLWRMLRDCGGRPELLEEAAMVTQLCRRSGLSEVTAARRTSTVRAWMQWVLDNTTLDASGRKDQTRLLV